MSSAARRTFREGPSISYWAHFSAGAPSSLAIPCKLKMAGDSLARRTYRREPSYASRTDVEIRPRSETSMPFAFAQSRIIWTSELFGEG